MQNFDLLNRIVQYIVENVDEIFSANAIANFLKAKAFPVVGGG